MAEARASYRALLKAARYAFRGDALALRESQKQLRARFEASRDLVDAGVIQTKIEEAREAADFLRKMVLQSKLTEGGNYAMKVAPEHIDDDLGAVVIEVPEVKEPRRRRRKDKKEDGVPPAS